MEGVGGKRGGCGGESAVDVDAAVESIAVVDTAAVGNVLLSLVWYAVTATTLPPLAPEKATGCFYRLQLHSLYLGHLYLDS